MYMYNVSLEIGGLYFNVIYKRRQRGKKREGTQVTDKARVRRKNDKTLVLVRYRPTFIDVRKM